MTHTVVKSNDPCWCGSGRKFKRCHRAAYEPVRAGRIGDRRTVPEGIARPSYADTGVVDRWPEPIVKSPDVIGRMRRAGRAAADVLAAVAAAAVPGATTDDLDALCHRLVLEGGAYPSPLNYEGSVQPFPKSLCTSVNEVICHGIPDDRALVDGDIVSLDVTLFLDGVHGDTCVTVPVGNVDAASGRLIRVTRECLERAVEVVAPGRPLNLIGRAIQEHAEAAGFGVVRQFVGHGVGEMFHSGFCVPHYHDPARREPLEPGMTFTIEPMITMGGWQARMWPDGWTAVTADGRRAAQFEHTLVVTDDGADILTTPTDPFSHPYWAR
ncbi:MAG TPA: type I methionyl aminopeptidase [Acidimicrobiales bacterium]|nr:type I methionyl aminopeptidase [Acidimicrobiales bacterium]